MAVPLTLSSVPAQTPYVQYVSGSGQTVFPYPFEITQDSDLVCLINGVAQPTDGGYTLSGQGNTNGGNLTFTVGQTVGTIITLYRNISIARITQLAQNGTFFSSNFNNEYNRIYLIMQQLQQSLLPGGNQAFALMVPNSNYPAPTTLLTPAVFKNAVLGFDNNGNPIAVGYTSPGQNSNSTFTGIANSAPNVQYTRNSTYTGGTAGFVTPLLALYTNISANDTNYEWGFLSVLNNSATAGSNVAGYFQGNRETSATGPTWSLVAETRDVSGQANPTAGLIGAEIDIRASGTDTNNSRVCLDLVCTRYPIASGPAATISYGVRVGSFSDNGVIINYPYRVWSTTVGLAAFDCSTALYSAGASSLLMPAGIPISFDASSVNQLIYDGAGLAYRVSGAAVARFNQNGTLNIGGGAFGAGAGIISQVLVPTGATNYGYQAQDTLAGTTTSEGVHVANTLLASTAVSNYRGVLVQDVILGASATVTNQSGYFCADMTKGGTLIAAANFNVSAGSGKYNLYVPGTAQNFLQGPLGINGASAPAQVTGFGTPVGGAVIASYNITDAGGSNSNTNKCVAEILTVLKNFGLIAA